MLRSGTHHTPPYYGFIQNVLCEPFFKVKDYTSVRDLKASSHQTTILFLFRSPFHLLRRLPIRHTANSRSGRGILPGRASETETRRRFRPLTGNLRGLVQRDGDEEGEVLRREHSPVVDARHRRGEHSGPERPPGFLGDRIRRSGVRGGIQAGEP